MIALGERKLSLETPNVIIAALKAAGYDDLAHEVRLRENKADKQSRLAAIDAGARAMEGAPSYGPTDGYNGPTIDFNRSSSSAIDLDQPELVRAIQHEKPSKQHKSDLYVCRVYRRSGGDCQIYEDVKHVWWTADSSVLVIVQYTNHDRTAWRNISWLREVIDWYTLTHSEFE